MVLQAEEMKNLNKVNIPRKDEEEINTLPPPMFPQIKDDLQKWKSIIDDRASQMIKYTNDLL